MNTGADADGKQVNSRDLRPYYVTKPNNYMGWVHLWGSGTTGTALLNFMNNLPAHQKPKKIDSIRNASSEWVLADVWYCTGTAKRTKTRLVGTWPFTLDNANTGGSISNGGNMKVPTYPFHGTTANFSEAKSDEIGSPRFTQGKTAASYFDGHGETVRIWKGTNNPKFNDN